MVRPTELTGLTFDDIAELYGEEVAIQAGIASDPDTFELDDEWFRRARPVTEVHPHFNRTHLKTPHT